MTKFVFSLSFEQVWHNVFACINKSPAFGFLHVYRLGTHDDMDVYTIIMTFVGTAALIPFGRNGNQPHLFLALHVVVLKRGGKNNTHDERLSSSPSSCAGHGNVNVITSRDIQ